MPTTPPEPATATTRRRPPGSSPKPWRCSPWLPLSPIVAGLALSVGFHVTLRLWEQTKSYEPLDLSPPFAAKPLPGTSLENLRRRHGNQLPLLLNPATPPERPVPPPPALEPDVAAVDAAGLRQPSQPTPLENRLEDRQENPAQHRNTMATPQVSRPLLPTPVEPSASDLTLPPIPSLGGSPQRPSPPLVNLAP